MATMAKALTAKDEAVQTVARALTLLPPSQTPDVGLTPLDAALVRQVLVHALTVIESIQELKQPRRARPTRTVEPVAETEG